MVKDETTTTATGVCGATTEKPVPSITLSIAQDDVKRVLDASEAMSKTLALLQKADETILAITPDSNSSEEPADTSMETGQEALAQVKREPDDALSSIAVAPDGTKGPPLDAPEDGSAADEAVAKALVKKIKRPLHEMIYEAAQQCEHSMLPAFFEKMRASGSSPLEVRAGVLVFHDLAMPEKIQLIFDVLGKEHSKNVDTSTSGAAGAGEEKNDPTLSRDGAMSLFRSVIVAISSCIHQDKRVQIEMEKGTVTSEPPTKRLKIDASSSPESDKSVKTQDHSQGSDSVPTLQSPSRSFDSSLGTLREEDELAIHGVRKEFEDIAMYATDRLIRYCSKKGIGTKTNVAVDFRTFEEWRKAEGPRVAPWLALLDLARWKTPQKPTARTSQLPATNKEAEVKKDDKSSEAPKFVEQKANTPGDKLVEKQTPTKESPRSSTPPVKASSPMFEDHTSSRIVVSFDFTGSMPDSDKESVFCINITEENLTTLRNLVVNTGLANRPISEITEILLGAAKSKDGQEIMPIERFHTCLHQLLGSGSERRLSRMDHDVFSSSFVDFFSCFDSRQPPLEAGEVSAMELAVGFCFLGAGNKSAKLAAGFEMLQGAPLMGLTTEQLTTFLRSYLTMLCGISLLTSSSDGIMKPKLNSARRKAIQHSVNNGSMWTMAHFLKTTGASKDGVHSFDAFANWYTAGGFNVAPWLELLDLKKLLSLVGGANGIGPKTPPSQPVALPSFTCPKNLSPSLSSPQTPNFPSTPSDDLFTRATTSPSTHVLFTFPLANQRSLVVLKEDAIYVRKVVDQLGLLSVPPDELWSSLYGIAKKQPPVPPHRGAKSSKAQAVSKMMPVDKVTFVACMQDMIQARCPSRKRSSSGVSRSVSEAHDVLANFFQSFDLLQIDRVALNELMGGLTLLCGGKKSTKLAFAFSVFDQRGQAKAKKNKKAPMSHSLGGEDLFLFLRSFLIVMFSCCRQSWDLSDDAVNRYIADTANMITDDVMRYQWRTCKKDRVDFDEFGRWYNEGGFETAPWLELLDLKKWVLLDNSLDSFDLSSSSPGILESCGLSDSDCPPAPPDDSMDPSFFDDDAGGILPMDSIDEMDLLLMQPSHDKENDADLNILASTTFSYSPGGRKPQTTLNTKTSNSLKFHLVTEDDNGGYVVSVSQKRIHHLRHLLTESGLCELDSEEACKHIMGKARRDDKSGRYIMTKEDFDSAMREVISSRNLSIESQRSLSAILSEIFTAFDFGGIGQVNATEVACGFTVFCHGKKSDKLEYAFEVLDRDRRGKLSQSDTAKYLRSFLTVLLNVVSTTSLDSDQDDVMSTTSGLRCERTMSTVARAVEAGSSWAASQAFRSRRDSRDTLCFDEFAEWYTQVGYSNIPWLELLDLHKWVVTEP